MLRKMSGVFCIIGGVVIAMFLSVYLLIMGIWDIVHDFSTMSMGNFIWDMVYMTFREVFGFIAGWFCVIFGIGLISTAKEREKTKKVKGKKK